MGRFRARSQICQVPEKSLLNPIPANLMLRLKPCPVDSGRCGTVLSAVDWARGADGVASYMLAEPGAFHFARLRHIER